MNRIKKRMIKGEILMMKLNPDTYVRENAVVVYKEKVYFDVNHPYAFELALNDEGESMGLDLGSRDVFIAECIVDKAYQDGLISTWHWISDDEENEAYLLCNFKDDFFKHYQLKSVQEFVKTYKLKLGYFIHPNDDEFVLVS